jgi:AcrR family transcriptional regulator
MTYSPPQSSATPPTGATQATEQTTPRIGRPGGPERRTAILEAAVRLYGERGYRGTGLHALASEVGISHSGVLHHFGTKENLLFALVQHRIELQAGDFIPLFAAGGREGLTLIPRIAARLLDDSAMERLFTVLIAENLMPGDPLHDHFVMLQRAAREQVATLIRTGIDRGEFRDDIEPELIATEIIAFFIGMQTQWLLDPDAVRLVHTFEQYTAALLERLSPQGTASAV